MRVQLIDNCNYYVRSIDLTCLQGSLSPQTFGRTAASIVKVNHDADYSNVFFL